MSINEELSNIISKKWMGSRDEKDTVIYNIMKNYRYNLDRNSGFYKKWWEYARDSIRENSVVWLTTGIIGVIFLIIGAIIKSNLNLT